MVIYLHNLFASNCYVNSKFDNWNIEILFVLFPHTLDSKIVNIFFTSLAIISQLLKSTVENVNKWTWPQFETPALNHDNPSHIPTRVVIT